MDLSRVGIRTKMMVLLVGMCVAALVFACAAFVAFDRVSFAESKERTLSVLGETMAHTVAGPVAFGDGGSAEEVMKNLESEAMAQTAAVYTSEGARLAEWHREGEAPLADTEGALTLEVPGSMTLVSTVQSQGQALGTLVVRYSNRDLHDRTLRFLMISLGVLLLSSTLAAVASLKLHKVVSVPVGRLAKAADKVQSEGDYSVRAEVEGGDELALLGQTFNAMLAGIQARDEELSAHRASLEAQVAARTQDLAHRNEAMRLVMDNVEQGFVTLSPEGIFSEERSAAFDAWFGAPAPREGIVSWLRARDEAFAEWFELCWMELEDGFMPLEVLISQMPSAWSVGERHFTLDYKAIGDEDALHSVLMVFTDITAETAARKAQARQQEMIRVFEALSRDRAGFEAFFRDAEALVGAVQGGEATEDLVLLKRQIHTLKGNAGIYGITSVAEACHTLEDRMAEVGALPTPAQVKALAATWAAFSEATAALREGGERGGLRVEPQELDALEAALAEGYPREAISQEIARLRRAPVEGQLQRLGAQGLSLGRALGKTLRVEVSSSGLRLPEEAWSGFWGAMVHVVRNAVDHGLEPEATRASSGKAPEGSLWLRAERILPGELPLPDGIETRALAPWPRESGAFVLSVEDDGAGVHWGAIARKAEGLGLDTEGEGALIRALFADGVSQRDGVTEVSGRGVGTAAVAEAVQALGGTVWVTSRPGRGTRFSFLFPLEGVDAPLAERLEARWEGGAARALRA